MVELRCINRVTDTNNRIIGYTLRKLPRGDTIDISPEKLKELIKSGDITVTNLNLTSDNRLIIKNKDTQNKRQSYDLKSLKLKMQALGKKSIVINADNKMELSIENNMLALKKYLIIDRDTYHLCNISRQVISIPYGIEMLLENCLRDYTGVTDLIIPESVKILDNMSLHGLTKLQRVTIPSSVLELGKGCFTGNLNLRYCKLDCEITEIPQCCFSACIKLRFVKIPSSVTKICNRAFKNCSSLQSIHLPDGLKTIEHEAFYDCNKLKEINLPSTLEEIGEYSFRNCEHIESVTILGSVKVIHHGAFWGCSNLKEVIIEDGVQELGSEIFEYCNKLKQITLPKSVTIIRDIFSKCDNLKTIYVKNDITREILEATIKDIMKQDFSRWQLRNIKILKV